MYVCSVCVCVWLIFKVVVDFSLTSIFRIHYHQLCPSHSLTTYDLCVVVAASVVAVEDVPDVVC